MTAVGARSANIGRAAAGYRPDIDGLRAVALGALLAWATAFRFAPGGYVGVDVFFVISGFLVTGMLVGDLERAGGLSLARFYGGRIMRTLPLLAIVLLAVVVASQAVLTPLRNDSVADDVISSALFVVNWRFIADGVDLFGAGIDGSPVEHLWSLAAGAQFVVLWAPALLAATWWSRRRDEGTRAAALALAAGVGAASFAYCVLYTASDPTPAYFSTLTRAWEPALGAGLALIPLPRLAPRLRSGLAGALGVAGMAAIAYATIEFSSRTAFPGVAALVPTLGAAALITAGRIDPRAIATRALALAPLRYVGRISYAWFLWFWPVLVLAQVEYGPLSTRERAAVVCVAALPALLTHHLVGEPLRRARTARLRPERALALGGACTAAAVA
ncbi:MAG: acyltransferase family protein, partial [Solirubrobacterales bacterium]|nr:acyltransferase family protein [Solirubrobacterales bacterium]